MSQNRVEMIKKQLSACYAPTKLNIIDDSAKHAGHQSAGSKGHFTVEIEAEAFRDKTLIQRHRMIFGSLKDLMESDIHALSIKADAPKLNN
jgi:BolA protein